MITGVAIAEKAAKNHIKKHGGDRDSFIAGWYTREDHSINSHYDPTIDEVNRELDKIITYVRELYAKAPELDDAFMGHEDPLGNIMCLTAHVKNAFSEYSERRRAEQFLLFDIDISGNTFEEGVRGYRR
ncbi:MAG: hypothetical protein K9L21_05120 [Spirochaetia bacterium]|nr:hypothetical protein [Spirochaetia bacterium]